MSCDQKCVEIASTTPNCINSLTTTSKKNRRQKQKSRALKEEYEEVALQAVKRWPFLGRHVRTMQASVVVYYIQPLFDHATMHNCRITIIILLVSLVVYYQSL